MKKLYTYTKFYARILFVFCGIVCREINLPDISLMITIAFDLFSSSISNKPFVGLGYILKPELSISLFSIFEVIKEPKFFMMKQSQEPIEVL